MEPKTYHNLMDEFYEKPQKDFKKMFKIMISTFLIVLSCVLVIFGLTLFLNIYSGKCTDKCQSNSIKPASIDYIWPDNVVKIVEDILDNNMHVTNDDRAVLIKTELMRFDTSDVFYIIVYDHTRSPLNHAFYDNQSEYITVIKRGKSNVVIYRSHYWSGSPDKVETTVTKEVEKVCKKGIVLADDNLVNISRNLSESIRDINFLGLIDEKRDVSLQSANSFEREFGPGYWDTIPVLDPKTKEPTGKEFYLIAGYK